MTSACAHHPTLAAAGTCSGCGFAYCQGCLAPLLEKPYCGACRGARLAQMGPRVFAPARRWRGSFLSAGARILMFAGPLGLALLLLKVLDPGGRSVFSAILAITGIGAGIAGAIIGSQRVALLGNESLRRDVAMKLLAAGVPQSLLNGPLVGVAVGLDRKQYDGDTDWDVGFLHLEPGRILYFGDQAWFGLRPDQVQWVDLYPAKPSGPFVEVRLRIGWGDGWTQQAGALTLAVRDYKDRKQAFQRLDELRGRIEAWRAQAPPFIDYWLPPPPVQVQGGTAVPAVATEPGAFGRQLMIGIPLAVVGAVALAVARKLFGMDIPVWVGIMIIVLLSQVLSQGLESYLKSRRR